MSGAVFSWGRNSHGQLGLSDHENRLLPNQIRSLRNQRVVHVACGENHTVCLTSDGGVFSFGSGSYGQLGHNNKSNEFAPRKVMELMGTEVSQVACGKQHTLAFVPSSGHIHSFGLGGSGQLGRKTSLTLAPQPVVGPWAKFQGAKTEDVVTLIGASGDQSFAAMAPANRRETYLKDLRTLAPAQRIKTLTPELLDQISAAKEQEMLDQDFLETLETVFQSSSCLNGSLLKEDHNPCSSKNIGCDFESWEDGFEKIASCPNATIQEAIYSAITTCVLPNLSGNPPDVETLRIYLTLPMYHKFKDVGLFDELQIPFASHLLNLHKNAFTVVEKWLAVLGRDRFRNLVLNFKALAVHILKLKRSPKNGESAFSRQLDTVLILLRALNRINIENNHIIQYEDFYIPELVDLVDLPNEYARWLMAKNRGIDVPENSICNYPYAFDAAAKTELLQTDQNIQMHQAVQMSHTQAAMASMFVPFIDPEAVTYLVLTVTRDQLVHDTLGQITQATEMDLKKPLRIHFVGEEAEDDGGVRKEFFLFLIKEIMDPKYGMFKVYDETRTIWFRTSNILNEDDVMYFLIGVMCGLAIYNFT